MCLYCTRASLADLYLEVTQTAPALSLFPFPPPHIRTILLARERPYITYAHIMSGAGSLVPFLRVVGYVSSPLHRVAAALCSVNLRKQFDPLVAEISVVVHLRYVSYYTLCDDAARRRGWATTRK